MKTTIKISKELNRILNQLKYQYGFKSIEQVINHYLNKKEVLENGENNTMANEKDSKQNLGSNSEVLDTIKKELNGEKSPDAFNSKFKPLK